MSDIEIAIAELEEIKFIKRKHINPSGKLIVEDIIRKKSLELAIEALKRTKSVKRAKESTNE